jgi:putative hydroxymethylpyrimidine transport system substrate-binding protein
LNRLNKNKLLCLVTDAQLCGVRSLEAVVELAVRGGVNVVQLREKNVATSEFIEVGKRLKSILDVYKVPLIINDNIDVAIALGADGLPADTAEGEKMVAINQADIAVSYQPALMYKVTNGLPLVRFAALINTPLDTLIVLKNSSIRTIRDLKGKRIGYSTPGTDDVILNTMLKTAGLSIKDVESINVKFNLVQALLAGNIDGFTGGMRNFETIVMELAGKPVRMFYPEKYGFPMCDELILVTNKNKINDPRLVKFTKALKQGIYYLQKNPKKSWQKFAVNHPELNNRVNEKAWFLTVPYFAREPEKVDKIRYQNFAEFMYKEGSISFVPNIDSYVLRLNV